MAGLFIVMEARAHIATLTRGACRRHLPVTQTSTFTTTATHTSRARMVTRMG